MNEAAIHPHHPDERAEHFSASNGGATETEYLELLACLIGVLKPRRVLETGAWTGDGTAALAAALAKNGFGTLTSVELNPQACARVRERVPAAEVLQADSLDYLRSTTDRYDFVFLDSHLPIRADELELLIDRQLLLPDAVVTIHDTSRLRGQQDGTEFWAKFERLKHRLGTVFEFKLSRGLLLIRP